MTTEAGRSREPCRRRNDATRSARTSGVAALVVVVLVSLTACAGSTSSGDRVSVRRRPSVDPAVQIPGPLRAGFEGRAYPVPSGTGPGPVDSVPVTLHDAAGHDAGTDVAPAGTPVTVRPAPGRPNDVAIAWRRGITATAPRSAFWAVPPFISLKDVKVTVDGAVRPLGTAGLHIHGGSPALFTDPATHRFDGLIATNRAYLACQRDTWGIGQQIFAADLVEDGLLRRDRGLLDLGVRALDWGVALPIDASGAHELHRSCDGRTVADFGSTHQTTQWLETLGRTTYMLASSPWAGEYRPTIDRYRRRVDQIARVLEKPAVRADWVRNVKDSYGNDFTHRLFMRAAAYGLASTLADNARVAARRAADAKDVATRAMHNQRPSGINPERGGFDVGYQMYGTWLAETYDGTLAPTSPMKKAMDRTIDRAVRWETTRIEPNGQINFRGTMRTCVEQLWTSGTTAAHLDPGDIIRAFLLWGHLHSEPRLTRLAVLVDAGNKRYGNTCPRDVHNRPERRSNDA